MKNEALQNDDLLLEKIKTITRFEELSTQLGAQPRECDSHIQALESSMSRKITSPLRNIKRIVSRLIEETKFIWQAVTCGGGIQSIFVKIVQIYKTQGVAGIKDRLTTLRPSKNAY